jgi:hypothetical protein
MWTFNSGMKFTNKFKFKFEIRIWKKKERKTKRKEEESLPGPRMPIQPNISLAARSPTLETTRRR